MTIVTKPISSEKKKEPLPDVALPMPNDDTPMIQSAAQEVNAEGYIFFLSLYRILKVLFFVLFLGIIGLTGYWLFLHASAASRLRLQKGSCSLPFNSPLPDDIAYASLIDNHEEEKNPIEMNEVEVTEYDVTVDDAVQLNDQGDLEFDFEIDVESETYEMTFMPKLSHGVYLHDFEVDKTLIVDVDNDRCFIMDLDRTEIQPPKTLFDLINKINEGQFSLDFQEIRQETRVVLPALEFIDVNEYGKWVEKACFHRTSYRLEKVEDNFLVKRSTDAQPFQFIEFGGKSFIKYNIVNLADI